ncbi:MAG: DnaJ domain-containing protein [Thermoplasmatota archaeon]
MVPYRPCSRYAFTIIAASVLVLVALILIQNSDAQTEPTRTSVLYSANMESVVVEETLCLAGHKWYQLDVVFFDFSGVGLESIEVDFRVGTDTTEVFSFDAALNEVQQVGLHGQLNLRDPETGLQDGRNLTFGIEMFFHLNWSFDKTFTLLPSLIVNGSSPIMDSVSQLEMKVHGNLDPYTFDAVDQFDGTLSTGQTMGSNTSLTFRNLKFRYYHSIYAISSFDPVPSEIPPVISDGTTQWPASWDGEGYSVSLPLPEQDQGKVTFTMMLPGILDEWQTKVGTWRFIIDLDGMGPAFNLLAPLVKQSDADFQWEATVTDFPSGNGNHLVDGSSLAYRIYRNGAWGAWSELDDRDDSPSITISGSGTGTPGTNATKIQFRAEDVFGNPGASQIFNIEINQPPTLTLPSGLDGSEFLDNETLSLNGYDFASDLDDEVLTFDWYLDDSTRPITTSANFTKTLFNVQPGEHMVKVIVSDSYGGTAEGTFSFSVKMTPRDEDKNPFEFLSDPTFLTIAVPLVVLVILGIIVVIIILISKKLRKSDDFVINEGATMSATQAEEMAKKIRDMYQDKSEYRSEKASFDEAGIEDDEGKFDFDYDLYEVLAIERTASDMEVKKAYRKLAAFYHPDRVAVHKEVTVEEASEEMVKINKAKEFLLNSELRVEYDRYISDMDFSMDLNDEEDQGEDFDDGWD